MFWLHHFGQHGSGLNVLAYLHREIDQHPADAGSNFERIELLLLQCGESARLVYLRLLLRELSFNGFLAFLLIASLCPSRSFLVVSSSALPLDDL